MNDDARRKERQVLAVVRETGGVVTAPAQAVPIGPNRHQLIYLPPDDGDWIFEGVTPDKSVALWRAKRTQPQGEASHDDDESSTTDAPRTDA